MKMTNSQDRFEQDLREHAYFGISSTEFFHDFGLLVRNTIRKLLKSLEKILLDSLSQNCSDVIIKEQIREVYNLYILKSKGLLKKFEDVSKDIFSLPSDVEVIPWEVTDVSDEEVQRLKRENDEATEEYLQEVYLNFQLQNRIKRLDRVVQRVEKEQKIEEEVTSLLTKLRNLEQLYHLEFETILINNKHTLK